MLHSSSPFSHSSYTERGDQLHTFFALYNVGSASGRQHDIRRVSKPRPVALQSLQAITAGARNGRPALQLLSGSALALLGAVCCLKEKGQFGNGCRDFCRLAQALASFKPSGASPRSHSSSPPAQAANKGLSAPLQMAK